MTTIAGLVHDGSVYLGGDSCVSQGNAYVLQAEPKVFLRGPVAVGIYGGTPWEHALRAWEPGPLPRDRRKHGPRLGLWLRQRCADLVKGRIFDGDDGAVLGFAGRLWCLESNGCVWPVLGDVYGGGSGEEVARGALLVAKGPPRNRILAALRAAEAVTLGTKGPFHVVTTSL